MKVYLTETSRVYPGDHPAITLQEDNWDDIGFRTSFNAQLWLDTHQLMYLGKVKVMQFDMQPGHTPLKEFYPNGLSDDFASLGADYDYYDRISLTVLGADVLKALRDVAVDPARLRRFKDQPAFTHSLHRLAPARDALSRVLKEKRWTDAQAQRRKASPSPSAPSRRRPSAGRKSEPPGGVAEAQPAAGVPEPETEIPLKLAFTPVQSATKKLAPREIVFDFEGPKELPRNMIALIGPNGTGKTTLLADLALALFFGTQITPGDVHRGEIRLESGSVRDVIFISYSAYDSFEIPQQQELTGDAETELASQGYIYIGLRKLEVENLAAARHDRRHTLKSVREIEEEFTQVVNRLGAMSDQAQGSSQPVDRRALFARAVKGLLNDPSLVSITAIPPRSGTDRVIRGITKLFPSLSTGHKAMMNIVASLCLHLKRNSLVLMDEPEAHLHPPLIASLLTVVRELLKEFQSHALVATHSPVVIQETLGRHVLVLSRIGTRTNWRKSDRETFGENLATLTRDSLGLPAAKADYIGRLAQLIGKDTLLEHVEKLFEGGMSSPARAQALRIISAVRDGRKP